MHPVLSLSFSRAEAELPREVGNAHARWSTRRSVIVTIEDASGQRGRGEAAPLPGVSRESLEDVIDALSALGTTIEPSELELRALPPSLRFAMESAMLELRAGERPAYAALAGDAALWRVPESLALQVMLDELDDAIPRADEAFARGARAFKVKIGREGRASDAASLLAHLRTLGRAVVIRADANGHLDDVETLAPALAAARVEYVEDPCAIDVEGDGLARWIASPLALDAPLGVDPRRVMTQARSLAASVVVLKPTLLGGLDETLALAARARGRGLKVVLSHALEGPVGLAALAHLALAASAAAPRALWGPQGLSPWPGSDRFVLEAQGGSLALPDYLEAARIVRPASAGFGLP